MKKYILTITIILLTLFLFTKVFKGSKLESIDLYEENNYSLEFENLNSKKLDELFKGIYAVIIEIEVETPTFTKSYELNWTANNNLEAKLNEYVYEDLKTLNQYDLLAEYTIKGYKITRIDLKCTYETLLKIKERSV